MAAPPRPRIREFFEHEGQPFPRALDAAARVPLLGIPARRALEGRFEALLHDACLARGLDEEDPASALDAYWAFEAAWGAVNEAEEALPSWLRDELQHAVEDALPVAP